MRIISAPDVDLIDPFPYSEIPHLYSWMHAYKNIVESDLSPRNLPDFTAYMEKVLPTCTSYGVIDRNNTLGFRQDAPIIGMVMFEPNTPWNKYVHIASNRKAWGSGFMDQAVKAAMEDIFTTEPELLRISSYAISNNSPARAFAKRIGAQFEGVMKDMVMYKGKPKTIVHYGMTREMWNEITTRAREAGEYIILDTLVNTTEA